MARSRAAQQQERRRAGSGRRDNVMKRGGSTMFKIPDGMNLFIPKDKTYRFDFVLYEVGEGNPCADPGEWYYERTFYAHPRIGVDERWVVCPAQTAGKPCPICEDRARLARQSDQDEDHKKLVKDLRPKNRQLWLLRDRDEEDKGVQIFEFSNWKFGRLLDELRQDADDDELHVIDFDDDKAGAIVKVKFSDTGEYGVEARSMEFRPRPKGLPEELLDHGVCLDDLFIIHSYDELKAMYFQIDDDDDEPEEKPQRSRGKKKPEPESDDDSDDDDDGRGPGDDEPKERSKSRRSKKPDPEPEEDDDDDDDPDEDNCVACEGSGKSSKGRQCRACSGTGKKKEDDQDDDEPEPEPKPKRKSTKKKEPESDDDDDWGDDWGDD